MSNGLDDLDNRRRRGRQAPPPKHPRSEQPAPTTSSEQATTEPETSPPSEPEQAAPVASERDVEQRRSDAARSDRPPSIEAYLDEELMERLWEVEAAAVARRERHLQSPVVRLALRELFRRYTPAQVVERVLAASPPKSGKRGRPRR